MMEIRSFNISAEGEDLKVSGFMPTNSLSEVLTGKNGKKFREKIAPGAFKRALELRNKDVDFLAEHDKNRILSSTRNDSLELEERSEGLFFSAEITPTSFGSDYFQLVKSGILKNVSFGFKALKDSWERRGNEMIRTITELELFEVSIVRTPAYADTELAARGINLIEEIEIPELPEQTKTTEKRGNNMQVLVNETRVIEDLGTEIRALTVTADGAAIVSTNTANGIVLKMEETSPVFARATKFTSDIGGSLKIPKETALSSAGFVGEGLNVAELALNLGEVVLTQKRIGAAMSLSNQLVNDASIDITSYAENLLARRTAKAVEKSIFLGAGGLEFAGIFNDAGITKVDTAAVNIVTMDDLVGLTLALNTEYAKKAAFYCSRPFFNMIAKMKDGNGHYFVQKGLVNGAFQYSLFGSEVIVSDAIVSTQYPVIFGSIEDGYAMLVKRGFAIQKIIADTTQALRGSQLLVMDGYMDGNVYNVQAIVKLNVKTA